MEKAAAAAGGRDIDVFSPSVGWQLLRSGRIDELRLHVAPLILGGGTRLFGDLGDEHIQLELVDYRRSTRATHLHYRIVSVGEVGTHGRARHEWSHAAGAHL